MIFQVTAKNLSQKNAIITVVESEVIFDEEVIPPSKALISSNGITNITCSFNKTVKFSSSVFEGSLEFKATVSCDGLSATTPEFKLANTQKEEQKSSKEEEKCICKKAKWSIDDTVFIVTQLRKMDELTFGKDYDEKGNPYFVDNNGNKISSNDRGRAPFEGAKFYMKESSLFDKKASDNIEVGDRLFFLKASGENIKSSERNYNDFTQQLNYMFQKYEINTCIRKIHFLGQSYTETNKFRSTYEEFPSINVVGGEYYRGRGLKQITHDYNYLEYYSYTKNNSLYKIYIDNRLKNEFEGVIQFNKRTNNEYISIESMKDFNNFIPLLSKEIFYACDAAGWYWKKNSINKYADEDSIINVSAMVNNHSALNTKDPDDKINDYDRRKLFYDYLKDIFNYGECK